MNAPRIYYRLPVWQTHRLRRRKVNPDLQRWANQVAATWAIGADGVEYWYWYEKCPPVPNPHIGIIRRKLDKAGIAYRVVDDPHADQIKSYIIITNQEE